jgi:N-acetylglucosamine-6-phosphate deacetylase
MPAASGEAPPPLLITGSTVVSADGLWSPGWLVAAGGRIQALGPGEAPGGVRAEVTALGTVVDGRGCVLLPGFIDVHVHGGDGADAMDADADGLRRMARFHARHGVTSLLPTTWSAPPAALEAAVGAIAEAAGPVDAGATILGAHLEGPWINPARAGAQDPAGIRPPDPAEAHRLLELGRGAVRLVALAPEMPGAGDVIWACRERGVVVAAGHTEANWGEMVAAVAAGVRHVTHTFNAMGGLGHREPGTAGAALALPELRCELIADGHHVHSGAMAVLARAKGPEGVVLISDAVRAAGLPEGDVDLGGRPAQHCCGAVRLADGRLAGSVLTLDVALRRFAAASGWDWPDLARAAAGNAAAALGLATKGRLAAGLDADLVLLADDGAGDVLLTVVEGRVVHRRR